MLSAFYTTDLDTLEIPNSKHLVKNQGLIQLKFMLKTPISGADAAVSSSRSVCTRATEMRYVYPLAFHTAREDGETDSTRQTVRSTTQRQRPNPLPCRVLRIASRGRMRRARILRRIFCAS